MSPDDAQGAGASASRPSSRFAAVPTDVSPSVILGAVDIDDALLLSDEARWNQLAEDWALFMSPGETYGVRSDGRLVASAAILPFAGGFGWISMVLVTASSRRQGLASKLMGRCIDALRARGAASLLDATPEGALVYAQLGFQTRCRMARWRGTGTGARPGLAAVQPDRSVILKRDLEAFGGDRGFMLNDFLDRPGSIVLGDSRSFILLRQGRRAVQVGPLVAASAIEARELLDLALSHVSGPVIIDVLQAGEDLHPVLEKHGFEAFRTFERMVLDRDDLPGIVSDMMVAAGPEFG